MKLVLFGRSNVGKSTLFNRLHGRKRARTAPAPHLTRDCRRGDWAHGSSAVLNGRVELVDTPGWQEQPADGLGHALSALSADAARAADMVALVCDAQAGLLPEDMACARWLHRLGKPLLLIVNKSERAAAADMKDWQRLGLGEPTEISALHGSGLNFLARQVADKRAVLPDKADEGSGQQTSAPMRFAILGRPNVGKSTLAQALSGAARLAGAEPGLTRESHGLALQWENEPVLLYDTPGLQRATAQRGGAQRGGAQRGGAPRRRAQRRISDAAPDSAVLDAQAQADALRALQFAHMVIVLLEPEGAFQKQDLQILRLVEKEGRGFVIAVNKADIVQKKRALLAQWRREQGAVLAHLSDAPILFVSALRQTGLKALMRQMRRQYLLWDGRLGTGALNRWLSEAQRRHPPPLQRASARRARRPRLRYITQWRSRPPGFAIFGNQDALPESYLRYLRKDLRQHFRLQGVPLRVVLRKGKNPYAARP